MAAQNNPLKIAEVVVGTAGGRIGITIAPGKKQAHGLSGAHDRDLAADLDTIAKWGAAAIVTLMEDRELATFQIVAIGQEVRRRHMEWHHVPIRDVDVPDAHFELGWPRLSQRLRTLIACGGAVLVHCRGGLGRSGMIAARLMVETGVSPADAMAQVRAVRPGAIETPAQERWVEKGHARPIAAPDRDREATRDRALGALVGLAVGDALGTTIEFEPKPRFARLDDIVGGGPFKLRAGEWTDDTSMALALADSLLRDADLDAGDLMRRFADWHRNGTYSCTGECFDIGMTVRSALDRYAETGEPLAGSTAAEASGNGALMRLSPVAIRHWSDPKRMRNVADRQTRTTHGSPATLRCSRQFADLLALAIRREALPDLLASPAASQIDGGWRGLPRAAVEGSGYVVRSLQAAVWAVSRSTDFHSAVLLAANLGQDADTTAAIAGQLAGAIYGLSGIPREWRAILAWRDRIEQTADALFAAGWSDAQAAPGTTSEPVRIGTFGSNERSGSRTVEPTTAWTKAVDVMIEYWSRLDDSTIHPDDAHHIAGLSEFATDLMPVPWAGPLRTAKTYFLFLNPGLSDDDRSEEARPAFKAALRANMTGVNPYFYLLPEHASHPGYRWARRTFGPDIDEAAADSICMLQLVPYHSQKGLVAHKVAPTLPSSHAVRHFVQTGVLPRVRSGEAGLVVARSAKHWGVTEDEDRVVVYRGSEPRRAFQTKASRGGKLLRSFLT